MTGTWPLLFVYIFLTPCESLAFNPYLDPLLNSIYSTPKPRQEVQEVEPEGYPGHDYSAEPEHDSWDNIYLCQYCETEIIINPYRESEED